MRKFKFKAYVRIQNESLDTQFHLSGEIDIDFDPDDAAGDPHEPGHKYDELGEDDDPDWPAQWQSQ